MGDWQYGFVGVVTGANQPVGEAIVSELAGMVMRLSTLHGTCSRDILNIANECQPSQHTGPLVSMVCSLSYYLLLFFFQSYHYPYRQLKFNQIACAPTAPTVAHIPPTNAKIVPYPLSPSSEGSTLTLIDDILNTWGRLDVWVCSSGLLGPPLITTTTPFDLQKCFEANAVAPFLALKYAPPAMGKLCERRNYTNSEVKDQGYGSIIVVGSVAGGYGGECLLSLLKRKRGERRYGWRGEYKRWLMRWMQDAGDLLIPCPRMPLWESYGLVLRC